MLRLFLMACLVAAFGGGAAATEEKERACALNGEIMGAIQQARLDRVKEDVLADRLMSANPHWPESIRQTIPAMASFVYAQKRRDLRKFDYAVTTREQCLQNWEQIREMKENASN